MTKANPLKWRSIAGYGLGDMANNFVFSMGILFLLHYYTDVAGISAAAAGSILIAVRVYDAIMDVVVGRVIDHAPISTKKTTKFGRFRPYLIGASIPLLLLNIAVFSVPVGWSDTGKLVYAIITYALLGTAYSFVNIPYGSLASVMTQTPRERSRLSAARILMSTSAIIILASVLGPILKQMQGEALQAQLTRFTLILAALGLVLYGICFMTTREVVERNIQQPKWKDSISTLRSNRALHILCLVALCALTGASSLSASALYYTRYVLGDAKLFVIFMLTTTLFGTFVSVLTGPMLIGRWGKKTLLQSGMAIAAMAHFLLFISPGANLILAFGLLALGSAGLMLAMLVMWALESDTVEYGEWQTGMRLEGMNYSLFSLTRKCGLALGGSIPAFLLAGKSYVPNLAVQNAEVLNAIRQGIALVPAVAFSVAFLIMFFYPLSDQRFLELIDEIKARRRQ